MKDPTNYPTVTSHDAKTFRVSSLQPRYDYRHVSAASSTNVKEGAGLLHTLVIGNAFTVTVYDSVSHEAANIIGVLDAPSDATFVFDCALSAGLTISCVSASNIVANYL